MSVDCAITIPSSSGPSATWRDNYQVSARVTYTPDPDPVGCDEVAILQVEKATTTGGASFHSSAHAEQERRQTDDFYSVDRGLKAANTPFFGAERQQSGQLETDLNKAKTWKRSEGLSSTAYLFDQPGGSHTWRAEFQSCAVCSSGARRGAVLGCADWGFEARDTTVPNRRYTLRLVDYQRAGITLINARAYTKAWDSLEQMRSYLESLNLQASVIANLVSAAGQEELPTRKTGTIALLPSGVSSAPNEGFRQAVERWNTLDWRTTDREVERIELLAPPTPSTPPTGTSGSASGSTRPVVLQNGSRKIYNDSVRDLLNAVRDITVDSGLMEEAAIVQEAFRTGLPFTSRAAMISTLSNALPSNRSRVAEEIADYVLENCS